MGKVKSLNGKNYTQDAEGKWYEVESPVQTETLKAKVVNGVQYQKKEDGNWYAAEPVKKKEGGVSYGLSGESQSSSGSESSSVKTQPKAQTLPEQQNTVFSLVGKGLNYINSQLVSPVANFLSDAEKKVKEQILSNPENLSKFKKDVESHFDNEIAKETTYSNTPMSRSAPVPIVSERGREIMKERDNYLKEINDNAEILVGGLTPVETTSLDENGKTVYKTTYAPKESVLPIKYKPLDAKPDINIEIAKLGAIGKELMKITNPVQAQQLEAGGTPYLEQQAQFMGVTARAKYLKSELDKKVTAIQKNPDAAQAFNNYIQGKATPQQIELLSKDNTKQLYDEYTGLGNLSNEITHSNPAIRQGALKKAIFNELTNRYGASNGFLGTQGWDAEQLNTVINDYKKRLTDPRDVKLLDNIAEEKEIGTLIGDNQSWANKMAGQFVGTLFNTAKFITDDLAKVDVPNLLNPAQSDNRNKGQQLTKLQQADADKSNVTIDFKPDKKQFFLKQYVDTNPDSETFLQTIPNTGEMDGNFVDKVLYNSASQFGQLAAQVVMAKALPTFGKAGFDLTKSIAAEEFIENKSLNFITKVALPAFAMTYDSNYKQSFDVVGTKEAWKNNLYATLTSGFEGATELLGNPLTQAKFLTSAFKKDIGAFVKNLSVKEMQKMGEEQFTKKVKNIAVETLKGLGRGATAAAGESNEEFLNEALTGTTQLLFNKDYTTPSNVIQQAGQTWLETFASMGFMPATGVVSSSRSGWGSKLSQDAFTFLAQNKQAAIENINQSVVDKIITQDEANQKIHLVNTAELAHGQSKQAAIVQAVTTGKKLSKSNVSALTMARANEIELDNQIDDAKKTGDTELEILLGDKKKQYTELRKSIINDEMWIDPITGTPEVPPMAEPEEIPQEKIQDELQPTEPITVPKIKRLKGHTEAEAKIFTGQKREADIWLDNENSRLRKLFGIVPFADFKKEYDAVKDGYFEQINEAIKLTSDIPAQQNKATELEEKQLHEHGFDETGNIIQVKEGAQLTPDEQSHLEILKQNISSQPKIENNGKISEAETNAQAETKANEEANGQQILTNTEGAENNAASSFEKHPAIIKLEQQRDTEISEATKPVLILPFIRDEKTLDKIYKADQIIKSKSGKKMVADVTVRMEQDRIRELQKAFQQILNDCL